MGTPTRCTIHPRLPPSLTPVTKRIAFYKLAYQHTNNTNKKQINAPRHRHLIGLSQPSRLGPSRGDFSTEALDDLRRRRGGGARSVKINLEPRAQFTLARGLPLRRFRPLIRRGAGRIRYRKPAISILMAGRSTNEAKRQNLELLQNANTSRLNIHRRAHTSPPSSLRHSAGELSRRVPLLQTRYAGARGLSWHPTWRHARRKRRPRAAQS